MTTTRACFWHWPFIRACFRSRISPGEWCTSTEMKEEIILRPFSFSQRYLEYAYGVEAVHSRVNLAN